LGIGCANSSPADRHRMLDELKTFDLRTWFDIIYQTPIDYYFEGTEYAMLDGSHRIEREK
jgi:hypothetical protein